MTAAVAGLREPPRRSVECARRNHPADPGENAVPRSTASRTTSGLGRLVVRELVGVYEFVSAPFPAPPGYEPILQPEFPWDYFE